MEECLGWRTQKDRLDQSTHYAIEKTENKMSTTSGLGLIVSSQMDC